MYEFYFMFGMLIFSILTFLFVFRERNGVRLFDNFSECNLIDKIVIVLMLFSSLVIMVYHTLAIMATEFSWLHSSATVLNNIGILYISDIHKREIYYKLLNKLSSL